METARGGRPRPRRGGCGGPANTSNALQDMTDYNYYVGPSIDVANNSVGTLSHGVSCLADFTTKT